MPDIETSIPARPPDKGSGLRPFAPDKIFAHMDRVQEWLKTGESRPIVFEMDMANACNHKCPHCFGFHPERDSSRIPLDRARSILLQMRDLGARAVTFTGGGEPLVNPDTLPAVEFARSLGLDVAFITNGQTLNKKNADVILNNCVWVRISLDAATPKLFRLTHGMEGQAFEKVLQNIRLLVSRKKDLGSRTTIGIGFLTSSQTRQDILGFAGLGKSLGVDYSQYRPFLRRHGQEKIDYSDRNILEDVTKARSQFSRGSHRVLCSEHKYKLIEKGQVNRNYKKCYGQHFAAVVAADCKMYICCHMRGVEKYAIGDLSRNSMKEIWKSDERKRITDSVDFRDCPPLCRCDSFNTILWDLKQGNLNAGDAPRDRYWEHRNFL